MMSEFRFGDLVQCDLRSSHGGDVTTHIIAGTMAYADDVFLLATEQWVGMPCHASHLKLVERGLLVEAKAYHDRYRQMFPTARVKSLP
jgi:hypothetical protein